MDCSHAVIGACIEVHRHLGAGLLESAYQACVCYELGIRGLRYRSQVPLPVSYKNVDLECGYRIDLVVEESLIVEIKAVAELLPVHAPQVITYLKLSGHPIGLLVNFHTAVLRAGLRRFVNTPDTPDTFAPSRLPVSA